MKAIKKMSLPDGLKENLKTLNKYARAGVFNFYGNSKDCELVMDLYNGGDVSYGSGDYMSMNIYVAGMINAIERIKNRDLGI